MRNVVVVGGGLAGSRTLEELRGQGYTGRLTLVAAEPRLPYDRPPLSKAVLLGTGEPEPLRPAYDDLDVQLLLGRRATGLTGHVLDTDAGPLEFDGLVIATGAVPRRLPAVEGSPDLRMLRTAEDALVLRAVLRPGRRVVIVGAGWIGAEVATAARRAGAEVTVVEAAPAPLATALGEQVGAATAGWYAEAGVELRLGRPVDGVEPGAVHLAGGERLPADVVVLGIGVRPDVGWLAGSGVAHDEQVGVHVDGHLATSVPGVYAVGDCAGWQSARFGTRLHVAHWDDALHAPTVAAANLLGGAAVHDPVPYFWSEQFGRTVQYAGDHRAADAFLWRGDPAARAWSGCWLRQGRLVAVVAVDRPRDLLQGRRAIAAGGRPDPVRLADPQLPLKETLTA